MVATTSNGTRTVGLRQLASNEILLCDRNVQPYDDEDDEEQVRSASSGSSADGSVQRCPFPMPPFGYRSVSLIFAVGDVGLTVDVGVININFQW